ncbi:MAG: recombinase family protein, partial [Chloroflexi bacterium]|nr:recombinase family protein [Chloroflexota bacterium]
PETGQKASSGIPAYAEDYSARHVETPALRDALAAAKAGEFNVLLAWRVDRITRGDPDIFVVWRRQFQDYKVRMEFATSPPSGNKRMDQVSTYWQATASADENDRKGAAVRAGKRLSAEKRQRHTGPPPFGYTTVEKQLALDPEKAPVAASIFESYLKGSSLRQIARELTAAGVPPPFSLKHGNTVWASQTVGRILKNPVYRGTYIFGSRQLIEGAIHPADREQWVEIPCPRLVEDADWYAVQHRLAVSAASVRNRPTKHIYSLRSRIFCGNCGRAYVGQFNNRDGRAEYRHRTRDGGCAHHAVPGSIEDKVFEAVMEVITSPEKAKVYYERALAEHRKRFGHVDDVIASALKTRAKDVRTVDRLTASYLDPDIGMSKPEFIRRRDELNRKITALDLQIASLEKQRGAETLPLELESLSQFKLIDKAVAGKQRLTMGERRELAQMLGVPAVSLETIEATRKEFWTSPEMKKEYFAALGVRVEAARGKRSRLFILGQSAITC